MVVHLPRDTGDLPEVAACPSDIYADYPEFPRLITWQRMERGGDPPNPNGVEDVRNRRAAIADAQGRGLVSTRFDPEVLQALLIHIAMFCDASDPEVLAVVNINDRAQRGEIVRRVTAALVN